jgi:hypothetical protein
VSAKYWAYWAGETTIGGLDEGVFYWFIYPPDGTKPMKGDIELWGLACSIQTRRRSLLDGLSFEVPVVEYDRTLDGWWSRYQSVRYVELPLWLPLLIVALPTAFMFYRDRNRIPPGHCSTCGYNLTGNVSGVCPECGQSCNSSEARA